MGRYTAIGIVVLAVVLGPGAARAGDTPPLRAGAQHGAPGVKLERDDLPGPQLEVANHPASVETPALPAFELPAVEPGLHSARELRVHGRHALGTEIKVKGYVTWVYDCVEAIASANPRATRGQVQAAISKDPGLCERPTFSLADARDTSRDASIFVLEPAPAGSPGRPGEPRRPVAEDTRVRPAVFKVAVGDYVMVTGTWSTPAGPAEPDTDGVLACATLERAAPAPGPAPVPPEVLGELEIELDHPAAVAMRKFVDDPTLNTSIDHLNACNKAISARQYDAGIAECRTAITIWDGNHLAWYAWAGAHLAKREWQKARLAVEHAATLRPDQAMYQLYYGVALYEEAHQPARDDASRPGRKPAAAGPVTSALESARDALRSAVRLAPTLWRAHYYLGRAYRDLGDDRRAAGQFTATIKMNPSYRSAYVALIELYRRWDYVDQALAVATLGAAQMAPGEAAELWLEAGIMHDARHDDDKAIEAYGKVIAERPDDATAKFQRGQLYVRKGDLASARRDLEDVSRSTAPRDAATRQLAVKLLAQLAGSKAGAPPPAIPSWDCRHTATGTAIVCRPR